MNSIILWEKKKKIQFSQENKHKESTSLRKNKLKIRIRENNYGK